MSRKLTDTQHELLTEAVITDGVFHVVELLLDHALESMPDLELGEDEYICWSVVIGKEIGK